ncbi:MAG: hypothetical protein ACOYLN_09360 [Blastocatellia bacterium]
MSITAQTPGVINTDAKGPPVSSNQKSANGQKPDGKLVFSGNLRLRAENWDWFESGAYENRYAFGAANLRLGLSQQWERFEWQIEGAVPILLGLPENAVAPAPQGQLGLGATYFAANGYQDASFFLKQASIRLKGIGGAKGASPLRSVDSISVMGRRRLQLTDHWRRSNGIISRNDWLEISVSPTSDAASMGSISHIRISVAT